MKKFFTKNIRKNIIQKLLSDVEIKNSVITIYPKILLEQSLILILIIIIISMSFSGKIS